MNLANLRFGRVRGVSGYGPRCGCGGKSLIHVPRERDVEGSYGVFLCADCIEEMVGFHFEEVHRDQPHYWPGDEGRDEAYVNPRKEQTSC